MTHVLHAPRTVLAVTGGDRVRFLQDLVTSDLAGLDQGLVYAALLTPQGKYLFDFFLRRTEAAIEIDVASDRAQALAARLTMYRLRADVAIAAAEVGVAQVWGGAAPDGADVAPDPRSAALGWRVYDTDIAARVGPETEGAREAWAALRVAEGVPETGAELRADETFILEAGFERLGGVDFRKGCYVGQEVVARMKHKTDLRKGLARVRLTGAPPPPGTEITAGEKVAGTLFTVAGDRALAQLRFDRAADPMRAGAAEVALDARLV